MSPLSTPDPAKVAGERFGAANEGGAGTEPAPAPDRAPKRPGMTEEHKRKLAEARRRAAAARKGERAPEPERPERTPEDIAQGSQVCAILAGTLWSIAAPFVKHRDLTGEECNKLGAALDPVLYKYMPGLDDWKLEINLLLVVATLWVSTELPKPGEPEKPKPEEPALPVGPQ